ncbi:MAG TPA: hypothetical protein VFU24_07655 [Burkholderiales bacterium]|nr:hypothetical protein [Burkholderiales bacterium]
MSTDFKLTPHADYVHVALAPDYEIRPDGVTQLVLSVSDVCSRQGKRRVLIEGTVAAAPDDQSQFFRDVAQNRGVRVDFFSEREAALRWLGVGLQP